MKNNLKTLSDIQKEFMENEHGRFHHQGYMDWENVSDFISTSCRELLEQVVPEKKYNLITKKKRLTYSDVDDAYNRCHQEVLERIKKILE